MPFHQHLFGLFRVNVSCFPLNALIYFATGDFQTGMYVKIVNCYKCELISYALF
jgi:hypothetical protein